MSLTLSKKYAGFKACAGAALALSMTMAVAPEASAQRPGPFAHLAGNWSGGGTITTSNGGRERIRCNATYTVADGGHGVTQNLRCASDSYKFFVTSEVREEGGRISGSWQETTRSASGQLAGQANDTQIVGTVGGVGFTAGISIVTRGGSQTVKITPGGAADIVEVAVSLRRG
jgi:hypothetical protein